MVDKEMEIQIHRCKTFSKHQGKIIVIDFD